MAAESFNDVLKVVADFLLFAPLCGCRYGNNQTAPLFTSCSLVMVGMLSSERTRVRLSLSITFCASCKREKVAGIALE